ncbi:hypothetical protein B6N60_04821 [Richelia sinica FACHB-800]|uniref:DUF2605 domain-containing protein n=1 Tax=Richelia sinica FACHB-800 TaxID=1357546 RepID=A0A975TCU2_9NOST|nr:DUF2605 domain-containing protein [Richelia sinica]MBD2666766.1 DUF2605 domain-containing protein [Richelia sinica FACHB-800]QXE26090.1 hypothetical protein B6N60_04821 [Richelia sinica FACHB-800]
MQDANLPSADLLKTVLEPLLEDFEYWFGRSHQLLENETMPFMSDQEQSQLLGRIKQAELELNAVKMLFNASDCQVGIDMATLAPWHQLVTECWKVGMRFHQTQAQ